MRLITIMYKYLAACACRYDLLYSSWSDHDYESQWHRSHSPRCTHTLRPNWCLDLKNKLKLNTPTRLIIYYKLPVFKIINKYGSIKNIGKNVLKLFFTVSTNWLMNWYLSVKSFVFEQVIFFPQINHHP